MRRGLVAAAWICLVPLTSWSPAQSGKAADGSGDSKPKRVASPQAGGEETLKPARPVVEFAEMYDRRFRLKKPKIGEMLPDASAFDDQGKPFDLKQTRGKYTVLVFGCLT